MSSFKFKAWGEIVSPRYPSGGCMTPLVFAECEYEAHVSADDGVVQFTTGGVPVDFNDHDYIHVLMGHVRSMGVKVPLGSGEADAVVRSRMGGVK